MITWKLWRTYVFESWYDSFDIFICILVSFITIPSDLVMLPIELIAILVDIIIEKVGKIL